MRLFLLILLALASQATWAAQVPPGRAPVILGDRSERAKDQSVCRARERDNELAILACTRLVQRADIEPGDRAQYYHLRSVHKENSGDLRGALADIETAAKWDRKSAEIDAQRCWLKASLNVDLDEAADLCFHALKLDGPSYRVLDSLALLEYRKGNFMKSYSGYTMADAHKTWVHALYGQKLSLIAGIAKAPYDQLYSINLERMRVLLNEVDAILQVIEKKQPRHFEEVRLIYGRAGLSIDLKDMSSEGSAK